MVDTDKYLPIIMDRDNLHMQFGGGIPKGTTMLLEGRDGSGKSAVVQRLLYSFLQHGISVTVISTELTTKGFIDQMKSLDYDVMGHLLKKQLLFIPVFPLFGQVKERQDFLGRLMNTRELYNNDVIVIDTFSQLIKHDIDEDRSFKVLSFFKKLSGQSKNIIITIESRELGENVESLFSSIADIFIELECEAIEGKMEHKMLIRRFGAAAGPVRDTVGFKVIPGAGFIVDITAVA